MPLSDAAVDLLAPRLTGLGPDDCVFGAKFDWGRLLKKVRTLSGATFSPHDMRRAFASECAEHDIGSFDDIDALLAHAASASRGGVSGIYNRSRRADQRRGIMESWAGLIEHALRTGRWPREAEAAERVVPLRERRRRHEEAPG